jgi:hypothetical protein
MTLGCGAQGNNITSDNISPLHLINLKRVAYGVRDVETLAPAKRTVIENVVDQWLEKKSEKPVPQPAAPLSSYKELQHTPAKPAAFVCEEDVRVAIDAKSHIVVGKKTIVTPLARELGEAHDVFVTAD